MNKLIVIMSLVSVIPIIGMEFDSEKVELAIKEVEKKQAARTRYLEQARKDLLDDDTHFLSSSRSFILPAERNAFKKCEELPKEPSFHSLKKVYCERFYRKLVSFYKHAEREDQLKKLSRQILGEDSLGPMNQEVDREYEKRNKLGGSITEYANYIIDKDFGNK